LGGGAAILQLRSIAESRSWAFGSFHTPCKKPEGAEGMLEGDALDIGGDTGTTLICLEYLVLKQRRVGVQVPEIPVPIDTRNVLEVLDAKYLGRLRIKGHILAGEVSMVQHHLIGPNIQSLGATTRPSGASILESSKSRITSGVERRRPWVWRVRTFSAAMSSQ
jgi:hypothetical protein